ncbi:MAG: hypothetical protein KJZ65_09470 [Phycisphaerales bacterium]|nr:hypothetical protein [Phycisphaerales bacterium]
MKAKTCFALAIAAGCATVATANPEKVAINDFQSMSASAIKTIYYNVATGEMIRTNGGNARQGDPLWVNEQYLQCGYPEWYYFGLRNDGAGNSNRYWMDWGDVAANSVVDAMTFLYFTTVADPGEDGENGFSMEVSFFDGIDWCCNIQSGMTPYLTWDIQGIPGSASGGTAWLITVDFGDTPENWFEVGDADGVDDSGNGYNSGGLGVDTDSAGNGSDFGYGFFFNHPTNQVATTGCGLVAPTEGVEPNSLGSEDVFALYRNGWDQLENFYWFGGYACTGSGFQWTPWADYYLGLYEAGGGPVDPCPAPPDMVDDNILNFFDVQQFLAWFSAHDQRADLIDDDVFNFFDVQAFLASFSAGCP